MNSNESKFISKLLPFLTVFIIALAVGITLFILQTNNKVSVPFSALVQTIENLGSASATLTERSDGTLFLETNEAVYVSHVPPNSQMVEELVGSHNILYHYSTSSKYGPWILGAMMVLLISTALIVQKKTGGLSLGNKMKNNLTKPSPLPEITLDDIGGLQDEMKEEILQTLSILKNPERSSKLGVKPPKGILLYGPPGTGKTLLAQAIARELNAYFFSTSGSAFNEMFIGVGAARVRSLFQSARKYSPTVIFIDEVDALAGKRKPNGGEEGEKTLTELLVQLDGGHTNDGILFIAATNRKDMLDDAFLRPGRIDFSFHVPLPDTKGRREIIDIHMKGKHLSKEVYDFLDELAESTSGFSGAELSSLFETASRRALRSDRDILFKSDLDYAVDRTILGSTSRALQDPEMKRRVAIHEAGHAIVAALTNPGSVRKATIVPRGQALGYVAPIPKEMHLSTTSELLDQIAMILAGGVAERMYLGEHSIGVSGDVQQAKHLLEQMVDTGLLQDGFTLTFNKMDKETKMRELFQQALQKSDELIRTHEKEFKQLVKNLLMKETLEGIEVDQIVNSNMHTEEKTWA